MKAENHPESSSAPSTEPGSCQMLAGGSAALEVWCKAWVTAVCPVAQKSERCYCSLCRWVAGASGECPTEAVAQGNDEFTGEFRMSRDVNMGGKTRNQNTNKQNKKIKPCNHNWALCTPAGFCPLAAACCLGSMFRENQMFLKEHKHGHLPHSWSILRRKRQLLGAEDPFSHPLCLPGLSCPFHSVISEPDHWALRLRAMLLPQTA